MIRHAITAICLALAMTTATMGQDRLAKKGGLGLRVSTEFAYASINGGGQDYVIRNTAGYDELEGTVESLDPNDEIATTLGIAYGLAEDLDVVFEYSLLKSHTSESVSDSNGNMSPTLIHPDQNAIYEDVTDASIKLDYEINSFSLALAKRFTHSDSVSSEISFGFNHLKFDRELDVVYYDTINDYDPTYVSKDLTTYANGLKLGVGTNIALGGGFGAYGSFGLGLFQAKSTQKQNEGDSSYEYLATKRTDNHSVTSLEMGVGTTWSATIGNGTMLVKLGYELTKYDGLFVSRNPDDYTPSVTINEPLDLSTSGWVLGVSYTF